MQGGLLQLADHPKLHLLNTAGVEGEGDDDAGHAKAEETAEEAAEEAAEEDVPPPPPPPPPLVPDGRGGWAPAGSFDSRELGKALLEVLIATRFRLPFRLPCCLRRLHDQRGEPSELRLIST